ncbi:hypothetical protein [Chitinophaga rhizophila]|uniref:Uncharacterized protein n=1 Tax=Chitinophaga rhizophila TaxID=2866212 RepID=A0ABS7G6Z5_9BACT|nr:hypothetical protein [Chitinophaga rhizophila]MBW8683176.1 hypothetical protein [Chitinophaga rhizophila]
MIHNSKFVLPLLCMAPTFLFAFKSGPAAEAVSQGSLMSNVTATTVSNENVSVNGHIVTVQSLAETQFHNTIGVHSVTRFRAVDEDALLKVLSRYE